jgi:hypothetical protein
MPGKTLLHACSSIQDKLSALSLAAWKLSTLEIKSLESIQSFWRDDAAKV